MPSDQLAERVPSLSTSPDSVGDGPAVQVLQAHQGWATLDWAEIWRYRELLYFLTWRDVKIRYKQTVLGAAWAVLQPVMTMIVFTIFFGRLAGLERQTDGIPYPIYVYAAMLPWAFFANAITNSGNSLVGSAGLITKVYFPRLCIPLSAVGAGLVDFAVSGVVLVLLMAGYRILPSWQLLLAPLLLVGTVLVSTGVGTLLSALTVEFRDFRYVVPFVVQFWMYVSGVINPVKTIPEEWRWLYFLNPMAGLIDGFRSAFLGLSFQWGPVLYALAAAVLLFLAGAQYFRAVERRFADVI